MKNKTEKLLPKTMGGTVHAQFKRCGKPSCKCRTRGELHGAYFYHFVRIDGKLRKRYLKNDAVKLVRAACAARQKEERAQREASAEFWRQLREVKSKIRDVNKQMESERRFVR